MNLGKAIKLCRNQIDLTQSELAEEAKISVSYLSLLEKGKRDPAFSTVEKISRALKVPVSILLFLASEEGELKEITPELSEKLSLTALRLIRESRNERSPL